MSDDIRHQRDLAFVRGMTFAIALSNRVGTTKASLLASALWVRSTEMSAIAAMPIADMHEQARIISEKGI